MMPVTVAILAGGRSQRMGVDKASLVIDGETLLHRTVRLAGMVLQTVPLVIGRTAPSDFAPDLPVRFLSDDEADSGPVAGLGTALRHAPASDTLLLLSCDLPALSKAALRWLADAEDCGEYGIITRRAGRDEPLFSLYTPALLPRVNTNLQRGERSFRALIAAGGDGFAYRDAPIEVIHALTDVDTPEDWARFTQRNTTHG